MVINELGDWFYSLTKHEGFWDLCIMSPGYIWLKEDNQPISQHIKGKDYDSVLKKGVEILEDFKKLAKVNRRVTEYLTTIEI